MARGLPSQDEYLRRNSSLGLLDTLMPWFMSSPHTGRFTREYMDWKEKSPEDRARDFNMYFGSAFSPAARGAAEHVAAGGKLPEGNYWNQVIRNYVRGGGVESPRKFMERNVASGPGIHSDWNAVAEAADAYSRFGNQSGAPMNPLQVGERMEEAYENRWNRPYHGDDLGNRYRSVGDPHSDDEDKYQNLLRLQSGLMFGVNPYGWR